MKKKPIKLSYLPYFCRTDANDLSAGTGPEKHPVCLFYLTKAPTEEPTLLPHSLLKGLDRSGQQENRY